MNRIEVAIRDYRGAERADFGIEKIVLLAGKNGAGKSSVAEAIGLALTGNAMPAIKGLKKSDTGALVKTGASDAKVELGNVDGNGEVVGAAKITWPGAEVSTSGEPPAASAIAVGRVDLLALDDKERTKLLAEVLHTEPTAKDIETACRDAELPTTEDDKGKTIAGRLFGAVSEQGWDAAHAKAKEHGAKLKGAWEETTGGERYGSKKAADWMPEHWTDDLEEASEQGLERMLADAKQQLEDAIGEARVSESDVARLKAIADSLPNRSEAVEAAQKALNTTEAKAAELQQEAADLAPVPENALPCPHCGKPVHIHAKNAGERELIKAEEISEREEKRLRDEHQRVTSEVEAAKREAASAKRALASAEAERDEAERAAERLKEIGAGEDDDGGNEAEVEKRRQAVAVDERRLAAFKAKHRADKLARDILANQKIVDILAPDGLRKRKLAHAIEAFNSSKLDPLNKAAGWGPVSVDEDLVIRYGKRIVALCSESEQYRARVTLQLAIAQIDQSAMIVADRADILDGVGRNGLLQMLASQELPALVAMTVPAPKRAWDLGEKQIGQTLWIEGGNVRPLAEALEAG